MFLIFITMMFTVWLTYQTVQCIAPNGFACTYPGQKVFLCYCYFIIGICTYAGLMILIHCMGLDVHLPH